MPPFRRVIRRCFDYAAAAASSPLPVAAADFASITLLAYFLFQFRLLIRFSPYYHFAAESADIVSLSLRQLLRCRQRLKIHNYGHISLITPCRCCRRCLLRALFRFRYFRHFRLMPAATLRHCFRQRRYVADYWSCSLLASFRLPPMLSLFAAY